MRCRATLLVLVAAVLTPTLGRANLSTQMDVMFDTLVNVTEPTAHLGQRRGVFDGGSVVGRSRIMNENLVILCRRAFPPGVAASTSTRARSRSSPPISPRTSCTRSRPTRRVTNYLQKAMQRINQAMGNSCQMAKGLVNAGADAFGLAHKNKTSLDTMFLGGKTPTSPGPRCAARMPARSWRRARARCKNSSAPWRVMLDRGRGASLRDGDA